MSWGIMRRQLRVSDEREVQRCGADADVEYTPC